MRPIILVLILLAPATHAEIYKCTEGGSTVFSQQPCGDNAVVVQPRVTEPSADAMSENGAIQDQLTRSGHVLERDRKLRDAERDAIRARETIATLKAERAARNADYEAQIKAIPYDGRYGRDARTALLNEKKQGWQHYSDAIHQHESDAVQIEREARRLRSIRP